MILDESILNGVFRALNAMIAECKNNLESSRAVKDKQAARYWLTEQRRATLAWKMLVRPNPHLGKK